MLADRIGVTRQTVNAIELGKYSPSLEVAFRIASVFGVPLRAGEPDVREALATILALDHEGDVVANARISWRRLVTGVYNRRCVEVRGDLARTVTTVRLPMPASHKH